MDGHWGAMDIETTSVDLQADICPVSGLPILRRPEWTNVSFGEHFRNTLCVVGDQILLSHPTGYATESIIRQDMALSREVAAAVISAKHPVVWIGDYSRLKGTSWRGRRTFVRELWNWERLTGLVAFGLSPVLKVSARLALRFTGLPFPAHIVDDYGEAIRLGLDMVASGPERLPGEISREKARGSPQALGSDDWHLELEGYSIRFEVMNGNIIHVVPSGVVEEHHVDPSIDLQDRVLHATNLDGESWFLLVNLAGVKKTTNGARRRYLRRLSQVHSDQKLPLVVFYAANRMTSAAYRLSSPFAPFQTRLVGTREEALKLIAETESPREKSGTKATTDEHLSPAVRQYRDDVMKVLGSIRWDQEGMDQLDSQDLEHPFHPVFEAIALIKGEVDQLLRDREKAEREHLDLQDRLAKARKMEAMGLLAGSVAHDLNNVLTGIVAYPDLLLRDKSLSPEAKSAVEAIRLSGQRAAAVVDDLITIARGVVGSRQALDINELVSDYLASPEFRTLQQNHPGVVVESDLAPDLVPVKGSGIHLRKVLMNLVSNAAEAIAGEQRAGRVEVSTRNQRVDSPLGRAGSSVEGLAAVLTVKDNGPGIDPNELDRIFEPFYSRKVMGRSGTGLGLTVVWNTVQDHDGSIDVHSGEWGTEFLVYLPETSAFPTAREQAPHLEEYRGNGEAILVVDDVESQREIARRILEELGYRVETVTSGEEAVKYLESRSVDLVLLDMIMDPGMDGAETYEKIVQIKPTQKAIIVSGFAETEPVRRARRMGLGQFMKKPYTLEGMGQAVRAELEE